MYYIDINIDITAPSIVTMSSDFISFTSNIKDWNYNKRIKTPDVDPLNPTKKLNDDNCSLSKYKCPICLI
jgi:hypothetical protein